MGLRPTQGDENGFCSATALYGSAPLPFVIPPAPACRGAYPDFLLRGTKDDLVCGPGQPGPHELCGTHRTSTGNPGQPRDLQFRGPFMEMFFDGVVMGLRPT
jgi:hypothetical protein